MHSLAPIQTRLSLSHLHVRLSSLIFFPYSSLFLSFLPHCLRRNLARVDRFHVSFINKPPSRVDRPWGIQRPHPGKPMWPGGGGPRVLPIAVRVCVCKCVRGCCEKVIWHYFRTPPVCRRYLAWTWIPCIPAPPPLVGFTRALVFGVER